MAPRVFYNIGYRWFRMPWEIGPRQELVELVRAGMLPPGRAVERVAGTDAPRQRRLVPGFAVYLMTRNPPDDCHGREE